MISTCEIAAGPGGSCFLAALQRRVSCFVLYLSCCVAMCFRTEVVFLKLVVLRSVVFQNGSCFSSGVFSTATSGTRIKGVPCVQTLFFRA